MLQLSCQCLSNKTYLTAVVSIHSAAQLCFFIEMSCLSEHISLKYFYFYYIHHEAEMLGN